MKTQILIISFLLLLNCPFAYGWVLHGTVIDGGSCEPLSGVNLSSSFHTSNISDSGGRYLLSLGGGNWTITAIKSGYGEVSFTTPWLSAGAFGYNFSMLEPREAPYNCSDQGYHAPNAIVNVTTTINATTTTTVSPVYSRPDSSDENRGMETAVVVAISILAVMLIGWYYLRATKAKGEG